MMQTRTFGRTGRRGRRGRLRRLGHRRNLGRGRGGRSDGGAEPALDGGVNFIDTADVYGEGRSERLVAQAQGAARRGIWSPPRPAAVSRRRPPTATTQNLGGWTTSLQEPGRRLSRSGPAPLPAHRPLLPPRSLRRARLIKAGKIRYYGVSVERVEEALKAIEYPGVAACRSSTISFASGRPDCSSPPAKNRNVGDPGPGAAGERPAHRQVLAPIPASPTATTATSTATARRSTSARPSRACPSRWGSRRSSESGRWSAATRPWRSSRCAGS